jgi:hypothetical protein
MKNQSIFITYNPKAGNDQKLALRLHAIGAVNSFRMLLPDRSDSQSVLGEETKARINIADYFVIFSSAPLTRLVQQEIAYAYQQWHDKNKIIVVYDHAASGKNLRNTEQCTEILIDTQTQSLNEITLKIINTIHQHTIESQRKQNDGLVTLLGIGAGLLLLHALTAKNI